MAPDPGSSMTIQFVLIIALIIINAFFSATETAFMSVNKNKIKTLANDGNKRAESVLKLIDNPNRFLSAIQVVITLAGFMASAVAAIGVSDELAAYLQGICSMSDVMAQDISVVVVTLLLSYATITKPFLNRIVTCDKKWILYNNWQ